MKNNEVTSANKTKENGFNCACCEALGISDIIQELWEQERVAEERQKNKLKRPKKNKANKS